MAAAAFIFGGIIGLISAILSGLFLGTGFLVGFGIYIGVSIACAALGILADMRTPPFDVEPLVLPQYALRKAPAPRATASMEPARIAA